ncbi:GTP cyclohydrolase 1 [Candidatus Hodgkinia cicadicola]|nr:GTP cyclohydrolase 1 [Candidatus Hodgkinia cicadicola]
MINTELLIQNLISNLGETSSRRGLELTPQRVKNVCGEIYYAYNKPISKTAKSFDAFGLGVDLIYIKNIVFCSNCEHHMMPFFGTAAVAYVPANLVVGLSKVVDVLNWYSARLQSQERLTRQMLNYIKCSLKPKAIMLKLECKHMCMIARGVKSACASASSIAYAGLFNVSKTLLVNALNVLET